MAWFSTDSLRTAISAINPFQQRYAQSPLAGVFSSQLAIAAYLSSGMLRKVIQIPALDRVREWRDWQAEKDQIEAIETEEKRLGLVAKVKHAEVLRGIGGGALILIAAGDHATPLSPDTIRKGGLIAINVVNRWELSARDFDKNLASPTYSQPAMFEINGGTTTAQKIHPSRVICFRGDPIPGGTGVTDEDAFWGDSRLLRVMADVSKSDNASLWFSELVKKAKLLRIGIPDLPGMLSTSGGQAKLNARVATIAEGESVLNATVFSSASDLGGPGETINDYQVNWAGIPAMMDAFDQRVAAVADIPFTRLMGRSPAGMNATGQHDMDNHNRAIIAGQKLELRPCLEQIDPILLRSAGVDPTDIWWEFAPLDTPSEAELASTFKTMMEAVTSLQNTGSIPDVAMAKGIQNLVSERAWIPGLDAALAEIPEVERFGLNPDDDGTDPSSLQAREGGDPSAEGKQNLPPGGANARS